MPEDSQVCQMFAGIAKRYDCANRILSGGRDGSWRRRLIDEVCARNPKEVVDLATGSGEVAFALRKALGPKVSITALDFCQPMLDEAKKKQSKIAGSEAITFCLGDCNDLPFENDSIDALCIAFGIRNLEDRHHGFQEMHRVLRPGGALFVLEFSQPYPWFRPFYSLYLKALLPLLARGITRKPKAYEYLVGSIESFPDRTRITAEIHAAGFSEVKATPLTFGIVALHSAVA